ncbi:MAG: hypothetical protein IKA32_11360, partial [Lentisphaeria bacterium]|nr:hypothetical protein [Lentisphaeria bacterium]
MIFFICILPRIFCTADFYRKVWCKAGVPGETAALMVATDLKNSGGEFYQKCTKAIEEVSGIPASHVFINA